MNTVVRVGVMNNFNMTDAEINQLKGIREKNKSNLFFVNSNAFVKINSEFPSIITINPYFAFTEPQGDLSNVKAFRIKVFDTSNMSVFEEMMKCINYCVKTNKHILVTFQRFSSKDMLRTYEVVDSSYQRDHGWYRPTIKYRETFRDFINKNVSNNTDLVHFCDFDGKGCPSCNNCTKLTFGIIAPCRSLNLSSSGVCKFNCPDCFAKRLLKISNGTPCFDKIKFNRKQIGVAVHA